MSKTQYDFHDDSSESWRLTPSGISNLRTSYFERRDAVALAFASDRALRRQVRVEIASESAGSGSKSNVDYDRHDWQAVDEPDSWTAVLKTSSGVDVMNASRPRKQIESRSPIGFLMGSNAGNRTDPKLEWREFRPLRHVLRMLQSHAVKPEACAVSAGFRVWFDTPGTAQFCRHEQRPEGPRAGADNGCYGR